MVKRTKKKKPARERAKRIGVNYCRYSSHNQRDASIEQQIAAAEKFAEANDITIIETYSDRATTGRNDDRHEFQRMMKDAAQGKFDVVIAWKSDRLGRNMLQAMQNEAKLNYYGIACVYVEENFDDSAAGRFARRNMMNVNQFYSESMAENIVRGLRYNAENCMVASGHLPFGYKADENLHIVIDSPKDSIVREIFERVAGGEPMVDIYTNLNERGIKTSRGNKWTKSSFNSLIQNERYKGIYIYSDVRIEGGIPRIVSNEIFEKVQRVLKMKKNPRGRHRSKEDYMLTGKIFCGYCKDPIVGTSGKSKTNDVHYYYACSNKRRNGAAACPKKTVRKEYIEREIARAIKTQLNNDGVKEWITELLLKRQEEYQKPAELELLNTRLAEVKTSIKNLLSAIEMGIITPTTKTRLEELESENAQICSDIDSIEKLQMQKYTREQILEWFSHLQNGDIDNKEYQQQIFNLFLFRAYLYDDKITLIFETKEITGKDSNEMDVDIDAIVDDDISLANCSHKVRFAPPNKYKEDITAK